MIGASTTSIADPEVWLGYDPAESTTSDATLVIVLRAKSPPAEPPSLNRISALCLAGTAAGVGLVAAIGGTPALSLIFRSF